MFLVTNCMPEFVFCENFNIIVVKLLISSVLKVNDRSHWMHILYGIILVVHLDKNL